MMNKIDRIKELVKQLNYHRDLYYNKSRPEISDFEYDKLFDELSKLEEETGLILANSPTQTVGYEVKSSLNKVIHNHSMLSLDKTKNVNDVIKFLNGRDGVIMAKMDGLTCSLRYLNGKLVSAETRGNGEVGEDVLYCAKTVKNIPLEINCLDEVVVDGEVIITYDDFNKINTTLPEDEKYKHPRNLASGSIRQLDSQIAAQRNMKFIAWKLVRGIDNNSFIERLFFINDIGFDIVPFLLLPHKFITKDLIEHFISLIQETCKQEGFPIDGCVFGHDDVAYGKSLGSTSHHLRSQLAFKFYDEIYDTRLQCIDWTMGKTGILTPTAVFDTVEIDGTEVSRASLHNISIMKSLGLTSECTIRIYKANQIVPQVDSCDQDGIGEITIPSVCPICGRRTAIQKDNDSEVLVCTNPECLGKLLGKMVNFCSKKGMDIDGLSEATLDLLITNDYINEFSDIYHLSEHINELTNLPGLGAKSVQKLLQSIEKSREVRLENFITALGVPNIGPTAAKTISKRFDGSYINFVNAIDHQFDFTTLDNFGEVMNDSLYDWLDNNKAIMVNVVKELYFMTTETDVVKENPFTGKTIVVTGRLNNFTRDSINEKIASLGAKTAGSVSKKTDYLLTNEASGSSKYMKAIELGIPIITEQQFIDMIGE